jgi:glycosyltransferase involved in cell wall biosynthesis
LKTCVVNARFAGMRMTGVQRSAYEIVSRLVLGEVQRLRLVSPKFGEATPSLPVEQLGTIRRGHPWEQFELPRIVRREGKNAVLYSPMTSGPLAVTRQVVTIHDLFPVDHPEWYSRAFGSWYRWLWPRLLQRAAYVVTNSHYTRLRVLDRYGLPEDKVVTCHFAHSESFRPLPAGEIARFRTEQGLPERYLLYIGSIEPRKNLKTLIAAWKRTAARQEGVGLVVAGGAARKAVFNTADSGAEALEDPTILPLGYVADEHLPLLYGGAEAFVFPSLAEGFGLPVLEAMACGTPVVCSDNTALPEVAGDAARLVPAHDAEAWTEAIDSTLSDASLRRRMSEAGLRRAERFSWSRTAANVRAVLEAV